MAFNALTDSWAKGDPIPMATDLGPLAPDAAGLTGKNSVSDLFSGNSGVSNTSGTGNYSFDRGFSNSDIGNFTPNSVTPGGVATNSKGVPTVDMGGFKIPSLSDVLTGMSKGPGGSGNAQSGIAGIETWAESWFIRITVIVLGFIFIAMGLSMMKGTQEIVRGLPLPRV